MSRLEMNAEPSMEEILASIRKIVAEEPPGSRAVPSPARMGALSPATSARADAPSPAPTPQRGFMSREAFMRSSAPPDPDDNAPGFTPPTSEASGAVEPSISATGPEQKSSETSALSKNANGHDTSSADRSLNSTNAIGRARAADPEEDSKAAIAPEPEAKSIEAQLADLLGDELQALNGAQHGDADAGSVAIEEPAAPEPRPGFTVSRIGFTNGSAETGEGGDPFAFDLGPSPFLSHSPEEFSAERQKPAFESSPKKPLRIESKPSAGDGESASTPPATDKTSAPAPAAQTSELFAVPSVAATLGPHRTLEPLSAAFQPAPFEHRSSEYRPSEETSFEHRSFEHRSSEQQSFENGSFENRPFGNRTFGDRLFENGPFEHQANTPAPETASESEKARNSSVRAEFRGERLERMLQPAPIEEAVPDRVMEDAMADLLRPLLRTWLAENMPKIVERALRREMTERLLPGQKGPFD
jgi:cell pole-organizing protein PopZ